MEAYGRQCVITRCAVEGLLEAAHITPHAEQTDYELSNGLLLRSDIHTLFDLSLIAIDSRHRVRVSPKLRYSEYWIYNDKELHRFPDRLADSPNAVALDRRVASLQSE
ncbi:MAG: HNH endonuclease [Burkholderiales bacterium]|nr:HNH endonuclease [Burkholderiales bacterium]